MDIDLIAKKIGQQGGRLYYVGGFVRDKLMNIPSNDIDLCITGIAPETFLELFPEAFQIGKSFPVFQLYGYEFAFARKEAKISSGHTGFNVNITNVSIVDDLARRDITINSIAIDVLKNEIIDPFNGINDIKNNIIRATSPHFTEDPLRVYRVAQFAARFNFEIDNKTKMLMKSMKPELITLPPERIFQELKKALKCEKPSTFFDILKELNLLNVHFKEIYDLIEITQPVIYHPEGDAYTHSLIVLDNVSKVISDEKVKFAALVHDLGKAKTPKEILPHHYDHEKNGIAPVKSLCTRLKIPKAWEKLALVTVAEHMRAGLFDNMSIPKKVDFIERNFNYLRELEIIAKIDSKNHHLNFYKLSQKMFDEINGKTVKLPENNKAKTILHEKRISWLKGL